MPGKGFTLSILPHGGKPPRQIEFSGTRLVLLRACGILVLLLVAGALAIVFTGADAVTSTSGLRQRVSELEDSLDEARAVEARLDSVEAELGRIQDVRARIESLATAVGPIPGDSL